jgi:hypothetical protein
LSFERAERFLVCCEWRWAIIGGPRASNKKHGEEGRLSE